MRIAPLTWNAYFARTSSAPPPPQRSDCEGLALAELLGCRRRDGGPLAGAQAATPTRRATPAPREIAGSPPSPRSVLALTPEEGIFIAMNVPCAGRPRVATFPLPIAYEIAQAIRLPGDPLGAPPAEDRWRFIGPVAGALREETRLLVVNFPHKPPRHPAREEWLGWWTLARERGPWLFQRRDVPPAGIQASDRLPSARRPLRAAMRSRGLKASPWRGASAADGGDAASCGSWPPYKDYTTHLPRRPQRGAGIISPARPRADVARNLDLRGNLRAGEELSAPTPTSFGGRPATASLASRAAPGSAQALLHGLAGARGAAPARGRLWLRR